ncbi:hypothetical protein PMAYCL1PPCAC_05640 [Pristionchus mayeri]|uniref:Uncharacterized protein n=1 Tax=Pristionchus mayeri TaxID=1317129 RepID=A0AAN4ZED9_9BILA|nr:hypothetical protein PMAYCL1PPCAC_05640 [Pristionchus mayeri]
MSPPAENQSLTRAAKPKPPTEYQLKEKVNFTFCCGCHCKTTMRIFAVFRVIITACVIYITIMLSRETEMFRIGLVYCLLNILITSLLWAGAFASKKKCLPIYSFTEVLLFISWVGLFFMVGVSSNNSGNGFLVGMGVAVASIAILVLINCQVISQYYIYLGIVEKEKKEKEFEIIKNFILTEGRQIDETQLA